MTTDKAKEREQIAIQKYRAYINKCIAEHGVFIQGVGDVGLYTIGLTPSHGLEIIMPISYLALAKNLINDSVKTDQLLANVPYTSNRSIVKIGEVEYPSRYQFVPIPNKYIGALEREFTIGAARRYASLPRSYLLAQLSDEQNRLPGEPDYAGIDQTPAAVIGDILQRMVADK